MPSFSGVEIHFKLNLHRMDNAWRISKPWPGDLHGRELLKAQEYRKGGRKRLAARICWFWREDSQNVWVWTAILKKETMMQDEMLSITSFEIFHPKSEEHYHGGPATSMYGHHSKTYKQFFKNRYKDFLFPLTYFVTWIYWFWLIDIFLMLCLLVASKRIVWKLNLEAYSYFSI